MEGAPPSTKRRRKRAGAEKEDSPLSLPVDALVLEGDSVWGTLSGQMKLPEFPAIIDTRVLVAEIDAGRYPTIKRYYGEHDENCAICKEKQTPDHRLVACTFCRQSAHFSCTSTKFTVHDPGPDEDFMCHKCIGVIVSRRGRAEKRRVEKLYPFVEDAVAIEEAKIQEQQELLHGIVPGQEFECVAAQGRLVEDLSEMLRDAKARLSIANEMAAINRRRYALLENFAKDVK